MSLLHGNARGSCRRHTKALGPVVRVSSDELFDSGRQLTLRRQSHRRDVFSTPLNLRVFDGALSRLVWHSMADIWEDMRVSRLACEARGTWLRTGCLAVL
jgi:hypothetical protein